MLHCASDRAGLHPLYSQQSMLTFEGEQFQGAIVGGISKPGEAMRSFRSCLHYDKPFVRRCRCHLPEDRQLALPEGLHMQLLELVHVLAGARNANLAITQQPSKDTNSSLFWVEPKRPEPKKPESLTPTRHVGAVHSQVQHQIVKCDCQPSPNDGTCLCLSSVQHAEVRLNKPLAGLLHCFNVEVVIQHVVPTGVLIFITGNLLVDDNANPLKPQPESPESVGSIVRREQGMQSTRYAALLALCLQSPLRFAQVFQLMKGPTGSLSSTWTVFDVFGCGDMCCACPACSTEELLLPQRYVPAEHRLRGS